jgi:hypothetical protein
MSLSEKLKKANKAERGLPCGVGKLLSIVSDEDKEALELIFSTKAGNGAVSNIKIHEIIRSEGHDIAFASIRLHRSKTCRCYIGRISKINAQVDTELEKNNE